MNKYEITNHNQLKVAEILNVLGNDINNATDKKDMELLHSIVEYMGTLDNVKYSEEEKAILYYYLSNAWAGLIDLSIRPEELPFRNKELERQIYYLRLSIKHFDNSTPSFLKAQIYVNLGNSYDHIGRFVEAHAMWNKALEIYPDFGMALCNIGHGVLGYARYIDDNSQILYFQKAYNILKISLEKKDIYPEVKEQTKNLISDIAKNVGAHDLHLEFNWDDYKLGSSKEEVMYREWALKNKLFLNSLNDITTQKIAAEDNLFLPPIKYKKEEYPNTVYQTLFNQIKQEYVSARCFLYEAVYCQEKHFSDKNNYLMDMYDYSIYSYNMEKAKAAYRICYSIFDKIAYLLYEYFKIDMKAHEVNFNKIWFKDRAGKNLRDEFTTSYNWALKGLYWVSRDLSSKDENFIIDPDSKDIATIRNFIEHKSFKIIDYNFGGKMEQIDNDLTLQISREEFEEKTMKLLSLVRASIIYLAKGILIEESRNK